MQKEYLDQYRAVLERCHAYLNDDVMYLSGMDLETLVSALEELIAIYEKDV